MTLNNALSCGNKKIITENKFKNYTIFITFFGVSKKTFGVIPKAMSAPSDLRSLLFGEDKPRHSSSSSLWSDDEDDDFFSSRIQKSNSSEEKTVIHTETSTPSSQFISKSTSMPNFDHIHDNANSHEDVTLTSLSTPVLNDPLLNPTEDDGKSDAFDTQAQLDKAMTTSKKIVENQSPKKQRESKLFDVFLVVGLPQNTEENIYATHDPPTVLFQYPKTTTLPLSKVQQCFFILFQF